MHELKLDPESQSIGFKRVAAPIKDVFYSELIELGGYGLLGFDPSWFGTDLGFGWMTRPTSIIFINILFIKILYENLSHTITHGIIGFFF